MEKGALKPQDAVLQQRRSAHGRSLFTPDELMRLPDHLELVLLKGQFPALLQKVRYYDDPAFAGQFDKDPHR